MAAPTDAARQATNISTAATSHAINVGSPSAGTLLIVYVRFASDPGTVTFTGYSVFGGPDATDATDDTTTVFWRWADGAEGASDTLSTVNSVKLAAICWEVTGARNEAPAISTVAVGTTTANTASPTSVAPTGAPNDTLYLALAGGAGEVGAYTAFPTNYANLIAANSGTGGTAASNVFIGGASRALTASSSEDPGAFTHAAHTGGWAAYTVAIRQPAVDHSGATASTWTFSVTTGMSIGSSLETGTNGNTITTADAGSRDKWDTVSIGSGAAIVYDNAHAYGTLAAKLTQANPAVTMGLRWSTKFGTQTDHYGRFYFYATANSPSAQQVIWLCLSTGAVKAYIFLNSAGKLVISDSSGLGKGTSTNSITLNQWVRIEYHVIHSATVGQVEVKLFNSPDSATPTETLTSAATLDTGASSNEVYFGHTANASVSTTYWYDNMLAAAASYPGPAVPAVHSGASASTWTFGATTAGTRTRFGASASTYTFSATTAGVRTRFGASASAYTFGATTDGTVTPSGTEYFGATASTWTLGVTTAGVRTRFGETASTYTLGVTTAGVRTRFGSTASTYTFGATTTGFAGLFGASASTWTFSATTAGVRSRFGATASTYTFGVTTDGTVEAGTDEHFGASASTWTFGSTTAGTRTRFGSTASSWTFGATTAGVRTRFGSTASTFTFGVTTAGVRTRSGASASTWTFSATTAGTRTRFGATASAYIFGVTTAGDVTTIGNHTGESASTWTFGVTTAGAATIFGSNAASWTFGATTAGRRGQFGATTSAYTFGATTSGVRSRFGSTASAYTFTATTAAKLTAKAATASAYVFGATTNGTAGSGIFGATASTWTFGVTTSGVRTRYGASASAYAFGATTAGLRTSFGTAALTGVFTVTTSGGITASGSTSLPLIFTVTTVGPELVELDAISTGQIGHGIAGRPRNAGVLAGQTAPSGNGHIDKADRGFIAAGIGGEV